MLSIDGVYIRPLLPVENSKFDTRIAAMFGVAAPNADIPTMIVCLPCGLGTLQ